MKKVLIIGVNSYIGQALKDYLKEYAKDYYVDNLSLRNKKWIEKDFSEFDTIIHLAALVHKKENRKMEELYFKINKDLALEVARKAKREKVKQFIFMSSMAVYGQEGTIKKRNVIDKKTQPNPITFYGKSKLEAEYELEKLKDQNFKVLILRPPMIYGPNSPGNYTKLKRVALSTPIFPFIENERSMLHIDKLCMELKDYIDFEEEGLFLPQDNEYTNTSHLVNKIAANYGKKIYLSKTLGWVIVKFAGNMGVVKKIFGNLVYEK